MDNIGLEKLRYCKRELWREKAGERGDRVSTKLALQHTVLYRVDKITGAPYNIM